MVPGANIPRSFPLPRRSAMLDTTIAGSLPKPSWLAEPEKLWAPWRLEGAELEQGKRDAALVWIKEQEDAGIDIVTEGEQFRTHFVHGFLEHIDGIDWQKKTRMGIRDNRYVVDVPTVTGALGRKRPVHKEEARFARTHTKRGLKFTLPGPMTICDTIADAHYGRRPDMAMAFAELLNAEARELEAEGVDLIQFDEPAFNVFMDDVKEWGIAALHKAIEGLTCRTAVHICYGYGIQANLDWKESLGSEWRQYEEIFPALNDSRIGQVSLECADSKVPLSLIGLLSKKTVMVGAIDVATETVAPPPSAAPWNSSMPSGSAPAPIAAWRRCRATSPPASCGRSAPARRCCARSFRAVSALSSRIGSEPAFAGSAPSYFETGLFSRLAHAACRRLLGAPALLSMRLQHLDIPCLMLRSGIAASRSMRLLGVWAGQTRSASRPR
jgi:5-methyltetrahydropteroyltriglutamate--homocysteine methyltransferase